MVYDSVQMIMGKTHLILKMLRGRDEGGIQGNLPCPSSFRPLQCPEPEKEATNNEPGYTCNVLHQYEGEHQRIKNGITEVRHMLVKLNSSLDSNECKALQET